MEFVCVAEFDEWRDRARQLLAADIRPESIHWSDGVSERTLFESSLGDCSSGRAATVPPAFLKLAGLVACHRQSNRWDLLYRALWRLTHGERHLLELLSDSLVRSLTLLEKDVTRDAHKMKAFVRFRKVFEAGREHFIAWYRPDHYIVKLTAPFFARRFPSMNWSILTPDLSVRWDQSALHYGPGVPASEAPAEDRMEDLWRAYYASTFNPARVNVELMKREMPVRFWSALPEAELIPGLLQQADERLDRMLDHAEGFAETAAMLIPENPTLESMADAAGACTACDLHCRATQTVFGEGLPTARIVLVGEQPGDQEDIQGRPFVGPAGEALDQALVAAGIQRRAVYVTNVVKHFSFLERGPRRLHKRPSSRQIAACRPWLEAELRVIRPEAIVCLGATAAQALLGPEFRITHHRGQLVASAWCPRTIATWHPSAILRMPDADRRQTMQAELVAALRAASGGTGGRQ